MSDDDRPGVTPDEVQGMLDQVRADNERTAVDLGNGVRRGPRLGQGQYGGAQVAHVQVWDDEYRTTLVVYPDTTDGLISELFWLRKEQAR